MNRATLLSIVPAILSLVVFLTPVRADISYTGQLDPADPADWDGETTGYVGKTADGTLTIDNGGDLTSGNGYIGYGSDVNGTVTIDGEGSTWSADHYVISGLFPHHDYCPVYVGYSGNGILNISDGASVECGYGYIGYEAGSTGVVNVDGADSIWNCKGPFLPPPLDAYVTLYVGRAGSGTLNISGGATVLVQDSICVAYLEGSTGSINFGTGGGTISTRSLLASPTQLTGEGTIDTRGLVSDIDLVFDSSTGLTQTLALDSIPDQNITINLDCSGGATYSSVGALGAGYKGRGSLSILDGLSITSSVAYFGFASGSTGTGTIDGSTWTINEGIYVGYSGCGALEIVNGATVYNKSNIDGNNIAYESGSTGEVSIDGASSTWTIDGNLCVGRSGDGTLNISNGATVTASDDTFVAYNNSASGAINFGDGGGTLSTRTLYASPSQLAGEGTIDTCGLVSDVDLVFDSSNGLTQTFNINSLSGQNITINLDLSGTTSNVGNLGAGYQGNGSLCIYDGLTVDSKQGHLGYHSGSHGTATIDNSSWDIAGSLYVGYSGNGNMNMVNGASVDNHVGYIAYNSDSTGEVTVDGNDTTWTNTGHLYVGYYGDGVLNISGGANVEVERITYVGHQDGSTGSINFDEGTLSTQSLYFSPTQLTGEGTINTSGLVGDLDLVFDSTNGATQILTLSSSSAQNITINLNVSGVGDLGAGYHDVGSLSISEGVSVFSQNGYLGYVNGSVGTATVTDMNSV